MKIYRGIGWSVVAISMLAISSLQAAEPGVEVSPLPQTEALRAYVMVGDDNSTIFEFNSKNLVDGPKYAEALEASTVVSGKYTGNGIRAVAFRIKSIDGPAPGELQVIMRYADGKWKNCTATKPSGVGNEVYNEIPFDLSAGWEITMPAAEKADAWNAALNDVWSIGLYLVAGVDGRHSFRVDDFMLIDEDGVQHPMELTPLGKLLNDRFQVSSLDDVLALNVGSGDADKDGISDLDETLTGSDIGIVAEVVSTGPEGTRIKWSSVPETFRSFDIQRSADLASGFETLANGQGLTAADVDVVGADSLWTDESATDEGPYFYKVVAQIVDGEVVQ